MYRFCLSVGRGAPRRRLCSLTRHRCRACVQDVIQFLDQRRKKTEDNTDFEEKRRLVQGDGNVLSELGSSIQQVRVRVRSRSFSARARFCVCGACVYILCMHRLFVCVWVCMYTYIRIRTFCMNTACVYLCVNVGLTCMLHT